MSDRVWVKFVRAHDGRARGDVEAFAPAEARSLIRHGLAMPAPPDLVPQRQETVETAMLPGGPERAVTR